ncbi:hypothetical protein BDW59DRAFT_85680 [Aspergillus cavernicola]|uniref:Uncharacterized protein n=1 Tax=Aspergillus cavernicola TaxID=176166 RepID=A0ABR4IA07_9EURO
MDFSELRYSRVWSLWMTGRPSMEIAPNSNGCWLELNSGIWSCSQPPVWRRCCLVQGPRQLSFSFLFPPPPLLICSLALLVFSPVALSFLPQSLLPPAILIQPWVHLSLASYHSALSITLPVSPTLSLSCLAYSFLLLPSAPLRHIVYCGIYRTFENPPTTAG